MPDGTEEIGSGLHVYNPFLQVLCFSRAGHVWGPCNDICKPKGICTYLSTYKAGSLLTCVYFRVINKESESLNWN